MSASVRPISASFDADDTLPISTQPRSTPRAAATARTKLAKPWGFPLFVWLVHFVIVNAAAFLAYRYGTMNSGSPPYGTDAPPLSGWQAQIVEPLRLWDGLWYRLIAIEGYAYDDAVAAFWPALPVSMRGLSRITGLPEETSGYLIANLAFAVALIVLYRLLSLDFGQTIARRSLWVLALFPTALFFSAVYTESVFLMFAAGSLYAARIQRWWIAGVLGLLASLTRSYGVFLGLPLLVLFIQQYGFYLRNLFPKIIAVGMPALGPLFFGWHLEDKQGSWRQFIDVQNQWNRTFAWPWETMKCAVSGCELTLTQYGQTNVWQVDGADWSWLRQLNENPRWETLSDPAFRLAAANSDTLELAMTVLFIGLAVVGLRMLPLYQSAYLIPGLVIPLFSPSTVHPLMSMPRFGLTLFPLFVVIALLLKPRWLRLPVLAISTVFLILLTAQFANWYWVS
ncbi:MAG: glycosyltransferase family 39 protein [Thermomicrobiales bacterium]|nr:glycosyltransferase family 39 protein [Thermomicrobiales bacterium]